MTKKTKECKFYSTWICLSWWYHDDTVPWCCHKTFLWE